MRLKFYFEWTTFEKHSRWRGFRRWPEKGGGGWWLWVGPFLLSYEPKSLSEVTP